ncbi:MAG: glycosyltransferase family 39 protein [Actinomycetes bacterium]
MAVAGLVQVAFLRMPLATDPLRYARWGERLLHLRLDADYAHGQTRLGLLVPVHLVQRVLGISELSFHLLPFVLYLVLVGSTYAVGARLFGRVVGVVASLLLATSVLLLFRSSQVNPDTSATAYFVLAVALLLAGGDRVGKKRLLLLAAGTAACGMAYLCRENIVILAPVVLLLAWRQRWRWRDWAVVVAVAVCVLLGEAIGLWLLFGDPLARLHALAAFGEDSPLLAVYGENATLQTVFTRAPKVMLVYHEGIVLLLAALVAPVTALVARRRDRPAWQVLAVWVVVFWAFMLWSAGLLDPQEPHLRDYKMRYWVPVLPALCLSAAAFLRLLARTLSARWQRPAIVVLTAVLLLPFLADLRVFASDSSVRFMLRPTARDEMRDWLAHGAGDVREISTESRTAVLLRYYVRPFTGGERRWHGKVTMVLHRGFRWDPVRKAQGTLLLPDEALEKHSEVRLRPTSVTLPPEYAALVRRGEVVTQWSDKDLLIVTLP